MKKKLFLLALMVVAIVSIFAITASAAPQNYKSYEAVLANDTKITIYEVGGWDSNEGRVFLRDTMYTEAPVDSEGTYATLDWSQVKVLDFTNVSLWEYDSTSQEYKAISGRNNNYHLMKDSFTPANCTSLEKIITGRLTYVRGSSLQSFPELKEVVFCNGVVDIQWNSLDNNAKLATLDFSQCTTLKTIGQQAFKKCTALVNVVLPDTITSMGSNVFDSCTSLQTINWPASMKSIPGGTFASCSSLSSFTIPSSVTSIGGSAFSGCTSLTSVYIPGGVTSIGSDCWRGCTGITSVEFHPDCSVQKINPHTFDGTKITQIKLPNTVTGISQSTFNNSPNLETVWLGASFVNFNAGNAGQPPFACGNTLKYVYLPSTFTASAVRDNIFAWGDNNANEYNKKYLNLTFFYTGTQAQAQAILDAANGNGSGTPVNTYIGSMKLISADDYKKAVADGTLEVGVSGTPKRYLVYDYNLCEAFYDNTHVIKDSNDCTDDGDCDRCKLEGIVKGFEKHNYIETLVYANGYTQNGTYTKVCANLTTCTCGNIVSGDETVKNPIFKALAENGYATNGTGIAFGGYTIDTDALVEYNRIQKANGESTLTFGVAIMNPKYVGESFFVDGAANSTQGFIVADLSDTEYSNVKVMIDGLAAHVDLELVIALYAYTDSADVEFIQSADTNSACSSVEKADATLYTVSLTSVVEKPNTGLDMLPPYNKENA